MSRFDLPRAIHSSTSASRSVSSSLRLSTALLVADARLRAGGAGSRPGRSGRRSESCSLIAAAIGFRSIGVDRVTPRAAAHCAASPARRAAGRSLRSSKSPNAAPSSLAACGVHHSTPPLRLGRQQEAAGGIERRARALREPRIGEMHADARQQLVEDDRLGDVVDAAGLEPLDDVLGLAEPGHEDHRHMRERLVALEPAAGLEAVHARHHRVHAG